LVSLVLLPDATRAATAAREPGATEVPSKPQKREPSGKVLLHDGQVRARSDAGESSTIDHLLYAWEQARVCWENR
jgi:hypothetical protein